MKSRLLCVLCACILINSGTVNGASFTRLGVSSAKVSPDGSFVFNDTGRWTATGGWQTWSSYSGGTLTGGVSEVSYDGSVVAGSVNGTAYRWDASSGMVDLGNLPGTNNYSYSVSGISADGSAISGTGTVLNVPNGDVSLAYRWTATPGMVGLGSTSGLPFSWSTTISSDGNVVLGTDVNEFGSGFWTADGTWTEVTDPTSSTTATSADGSVIFGDFNRRSLFLWTVADGIEDLDFRAVRQDANDVSADGSIMVGLMHELQDIQNGAFIWDETNGTRRIQDILIADGIDLSGWDFEGAKSISADGSIITGWGTNPSGVREAWVTDFSAVPIPAAAWLFGSGLLGLVGMARRKKAA